MNISLRRITNENINKSTLRRCSCSTLYIDCYWGLNGLSDLIKINDFPKVVYDNGSTFCFNPNAASLRNLSRFDNRHL